MEVKELGHVVLYVTDIEQSRRFYKDVLGWAELSAPMSGAAAFSSGRTHHELLLIEVGKDATPLPQGRRLGMYHFGLKVGDTDDELREALRQVQEALREALRQVQEAGVEVVGASDHTVTHNLYILDPDGNEIELYVDVAEADWRKDPALFANRPKALRL